MTPGGDFSSLVCLLSLLLPELTLLFNEPLRCLRSKKRSKPANSPTAGAEEDDSEVVEEVERGESQQEGSRRVVEAGEEMETEDTEVPGSEAPPPSWRRCLFSGPVWMKSFGSPPPEL